MKIFDLKSILQSWETLEKIDACNHGLQTPRESLISKIPNFLTWADILVWNFLGNWSIFGQTIRTHFGTESLVINQSSFLWKIKAISQWHLNLGPKKLGIYSSNKIRKAQYGHLNIVCKKFEQSVIVSFMPISQLFWGLYHLTLSESVKSSSDG